MAVIVQCFHCNAILELDEGFRGGVCRCSTCGSLLQVPKSEEKKVGRKVRPATPGLAGPRKGAAASGGGRGAKWRGDGRCGGVVVGAV